MQNKKSLTYLVPRILVAILFVFIIFYAHSRTAFLSKGVSLSVDDLVSGQSISSSVISVKGTAKRAIKLTLNNRELLIDEEGRFVDTLTLSPGLNTVTIEAEDKFNNYKELHYTLWHKSETTPELLVANYKNHLFTKTIPETEDKEAPEEETTDTEENIALEEIITN